MMLVFPEMQLVSVCCKLKLVSDFVNFCIFIGHSLQLFVLSICICIHLGLSFRWHKIMFLVWVRIPFNNVVPSVAMATSSLLVDALGEDPCSQAVTSDHPVSQPRTLDSIDRALEEGTVERDREEEMEDQFDYNQPDEVGEEGGNDEVGDEGGNNEGQDEEVENQVEGDA